jgi:hypothetical protein
MPHFYPPTPISVNEIRSRFAFYLLFFAALHFPAADRELSNRIFTVSAGLKASAVISNRFAANPTET